MAGGIDLTPPARLLASDRRLRPPLVWLAAGFVPVVVLVAWRATIPPPLPTGDACGLLLEPTVLWRIGLALAVLGSMAAMAAFLHADRASLLLRQPSPPVVAASAVIALIVAPLAVWLGPALATPFFGRVGYDVAPDMLALSALVAALTVALANGILEEITFRGALMGWSSRALGPFRANVLQALVFGIVHVGADFTGNPVPVMLAVGIGGFVSGVIARRTGSLLLPIAVHAAFDLPLYYAFACRIP